MSMSLMSSPAHVDSVILCLSNAFFLVYDLNVFKYKVIRRLISFGTFWSTFIYPFHPFLLLLFVLTP